MNPFQLRCGNLKAEPPPWLNDLYKLDASIRAVIENGTEGEHTRLLTSGPISIRQLSVLPFFRRISSLAVTRLKFASHADFFL